MSLLLAPYTNAMRLGQGFNSYTQQICVDDAVLIDPARAENVITNDGTTMRIVAESAGKPSAWNRISEVINEGPVTTHALPAVSESTKATATTVAAPTESSAPVKDEAAPINKDSVALGTETESGHATSTQGPESAKDDSSDSGSAVKIDAEEAREGAKAAEEKQTEAVEGDVEVATEGKVNQPVIKHPAAATASTTQSIGASTRNRSSSVGRTQDSLQHGAEGKKGPARFQVKEVPTRAPKDAATQKTPSELDLEQARLDKAERLEMMKQEKERMAEQRAYQQKLELEAREEERQRQADEREEQRQIRKEKREYEAARRAATQKAISDAVAAKKDALTLEDLNKIKAQNQFADRFDGIVESDQQYTFDAAGARGPSQTVTYSSRFIDKLSDVTEDMAISGALSVKMAKIGGSGRGSFVDSDKFKQSDLNFYVSVKVANQTVNFKDALVYNPMRSIDIDNKDFNKIYGDSFISGFQEGGEFNAIISMKVHNKAKLLDIQAEAKVALTAGPVDITAEANVGIARTNLEMNTETTIQVSWCGGGHIKPMEQPWNIQSVMQAAARFPTLVADCPQRTYAILTKYDSLRSFVSRRPASYTPLQYENAQIYTNVLMDAFMSYKSSYKRLGDQVYSIQSKTLEIEPWASTDDENASSTDSKTSSQANTAIGQATASGDQVALLAAKKHAAAITAALDTTRFEASLRGLSDARKYIRRQMVYIVNEVDLIEKDPKIATDEDHEEPFQSPLLFETRLPSLKIPDALKPKSDPLGGRRIMAKTQTEEDMRQEQIEQDKLDNDSPGLYQVDQDLSTDETSSLDAVRKKVPMIGKHLQVSKAAPKADKGAFFNNLEFLYPEWQVESITIGIMKIGCVGSVEVVYENGLILRKGLAAEGLLRKTFNKFQPGERITSAAIEIGTPAAGTNISTDERVLSVCMYSNHGRRLLGQAGKNEVLAKESVRKDGVIYEKVKTVFLDSAYSTGTFKGFFGRLDENETTGGILRLGLIWGDSASTKLSTTVTEAAPMYDTDASASDVTISAFRAERDQARKEAQQANDQARQDVDQARKDIDARIAAAVDNAKQIRFGNGVYASRQSVSFRTFKLGPSENPFLRFENGNQFKYQPDGNLVVYSSNGAAVWSMGRTTQNGAGEMIFHSDNDGNLVAWRNGGSTWATETKDCRNGLLVFSSERPFLEIFTESGVRRCNYP